MKIYDKKTKQKNSAPNNAHLLVSRTDLNFDAHIRDLCVILTHTYFQSNRDSPRSFNASMKPDRQGLEHKTLPA